ncbi:hypothetical protein [Marinobacter salicampi]|uniref:hypothetical protein n=1 Tax=Marinobacter salicampi TaxID=435907 RepID=UPI00140D72F9|nr:hypothetical protein [Marinobacter salicampi]
MNRKLGLFALLMSWGQLSLAAPYGEWGLMGWADTEGIPMNEVQPGMAMPDESEVGFPAYPGAKVMFVVPLSPEICSVALRTPAPVNAVCDFYESKFKAADGYTVRSRDEESCLYSTDEINHIGGIVSLSPDPIYSSKNGDTLVGIDFHPKGNFACPIDE